MNATYVDDTEFAALIRERDAQALEEVVRRYLWRYSDHELLAIVQQAKQRDQDTPRYLVGMINDLNAFTEFSTQQVMENPAATDLYDRIREDTSYARAQLERALSVVAEATQLTSLVD